MALIPGQTPSCSPYHAIQNSTQIGLHEQLYNEIKPAVAGKEEATPINMCSQDAARSINNSRFYLEQSKIGITYPRPLWRLQPSTLLCQGPPNRLNRWGFLFCFFSSQCQPPFQKRQNNQLVDCGRCNGRRRRSSACTCPRARTHTATHAFTHACTHTHTHTHT